MTNACLTSVVWLAFQLGGAPAPEPAQPPKGPPPGLCQVTGIDKDAIELKGAGNASYRSDLADLDFYDGKGRKLTEEELRRRVKTGSVVVVASDENAVDPAYLSVLKEDVVVLVGVTVLTAREDKPGRGWTTDMKLMKPSDGPVAGRILGVDFKPDIQLQNTGLDLHSGQDMIHIFLILKPGQGIEGKTYEFKADDEQTPDRPAIHCHILSTNPPRLQVFTKGYAMRLECGKEKDGGVPCKFYLCLPDDKKSWIAGSFTLNLR